MASTDTVHECYSCGSATKNSGFCGDCAKTLEDGFERAKQIEERHEKLQEAREAGDTTAVKEIITEIAMEAV